jgi:chromosome segregation ATPase
MPDTDQAQRTLRKLQEDEQKAETDLRWAERRLAEAREIDRATFTRETGEGVHRVVGQFECGRDVWHIR